MYQIDDEFEYMGSVYYISDVINAGLPTEEIVVKALNSTHNGMLTPTTKVRSGSAYWSCVIAHKSFKWLKRQSRISMPDYDVGDIYSVLGTQFLIEAINSKFGHNQSPTKEIYIRDIWSNTAYTLDEAMLKNHMSDTTFKWIHHKSLLAGTTATQLLPPNPHRFTVPAGCGFSPGDFIGKPTIYPEDKQKPLCECGAHKLGVNNYSVGHSTWCPVYRN